MTCECYFLDGALEELDSIVAYLRSAADGPTAASSFLKELERQIGITCENPEAHELSRVPKLASLGYRTMLIKSYVALYFIQDNAVFIAHIFHQRQDYARLLF